jgi:hypothetical protein
MEKLKEKIENTNPKKLIFADDLFDECSKKYTIPCLFTDSQESYKNINAKKYY